MNRTLKNIVLLVATIITIACILIGTSIHIGMGNIWNWRNWMGKGDGTNSGWLTKTETLADEDIEDFENIEISLNLADVRIVKGDANHIKIEANNEKISPSYEIDKGTLRLKQHGKLNVGGQNNDMGVSVVITVDSDLENITGKVDLGDLRITDVNAKNLDVELDLGDISVEDAKIDSVEVQLDLGDAKITDVDFEKAKIDNSLGDVTVEVPFSIDECALDLKVDIGEVKVNGQKQGNKFSTSNGNRSLEVECNLGDVEIKD